MKIQNCSRCGHEDYSHLNNPIQEIPSKCNYIGCSCKGFVKPKNVSAQKLGRKGGLATKKKYGKRHYQKLAENMNKKRWGKRSNENTKLKRKGAKS